MSEQRLNPPEDAEYFVNLGITREQRLTHGHFCKDAPDGPHVDGGGIVARAKKDFRGAVP